MTRLLGLILHGCWHRWALRDDVPLYRHPDDEIPSAWSKHCECTRCGRWKAFRL